MAEREIFSRKYFSIFIKFYQILPIKTSPFAIFIPGFSMFPNGGKRAENSHSGHSLDIADIAMANLNFY